MSDARQDWVAMREAARAMPTDTPKRYLVTNHPEVTDPVERERLDLGPLPTMEQVGLSPSEQGPRTTLLGEDHAAFEAFSAASAALEAHAEQTAKLQADYRAALERVSRMAAKRNRGG